MAKRHFPVRPNLEQLKHQAKDLLRAFRRGDPEAVGDFREFLTTTAGGDSLIPGAPKTGTLRPRSGQVPGTRPVDVESARLADAQFVLARSYGLPN